MKNTFSILAGSMLLIMGFCTLATADDFEALLLEGQVSGVWELFGDPSPTPACWSGPWNATLGEGESYLFTGGGESEPCLSSWRIYCNADSLGYEGSWTTDDPTSYSWNFSNVNCAITAQFSFADAIRLHVHSESAGVLQADSHRVAVTPEGGDELVLLGPEPSGDVFVDLDAGIYTLSLAVDVIEHETHYDYEAALNIWWELLSEVADQRTSWSQVKALYR